MFYVSINEQNKTHHDNGVTKQRSVIAISYFALEFQRTSHGGD